MTDGGKFIAILGILLTELCIAVSCSSYAQEYFARRSLPVDMQTAEMIQKHYDGEVVLFSVFTGHVFLVLAVILIPIFGMLLGVYESIFGKSGTQNLCHRSP